MLRLTQRFATIGTARASISPDRGWDYQRIYEEDSCSEDDQQTFHGCFLLVTAKWTVIVSWAQSRVQPVRKPLSVRNS
jgi:hypothetical protein